MSRYARRNTSPPEDLMRPHAPLALIALALLALAAPAHAERFALKASPLDILGEAARALETPGYSAAAPIEFYVEAQNASGAPRADEPPGVLVFVSPTANCRPPDGWDEILEARNLIWICPLHAGNDAPPARRIFGALIAAAVLAKDRAVDPQRTYVSGFSGGGRVASIVMARAPQLFDGAIYFSGVNFWESEEPDLIAQILARRYVFVTGPHDFNQRNTHQVLRQYRDAGAPHTLLLNIPGLGHDLPAAEHFGDALAYLDERPAADASSPAGN
jgi:dienelactone hydrolase